jgi:hypothetical protein
MDRPSMMSPTSSLLLSLSSSLIDRASMMHDEPVPLGRVGY